MPFETADHHIKILVLIGASTYSTGKRSGKTERDTMVMHICLQMPRNKRRRSSTRVSGLAPTPNLDCYQAVVSAELLEEAPASETTCTELVCIMCAGQVAVEKKAVDGYCPHALHSKAQYNASAEMAKVCRALASATTQHKDCYARAIGILA